MAEYDTYPDDQPLAGPDMPRLETVVDLIRYCATIHDRFGDTAVEVGSLQWGGTALNTRGRLIVELEQAQAEIERLTGAIECRDATIRGQVVAMNQAAEEIEKRQARIEVLEAVKKAAHDLLWVRADPDLYNAAVVKLDEALAAEDE